MCRRAREWPGSSDRKKRCARGICTYSAAHSHGNVFVNAQSLLEKAMDVLRTSTEATRGTALKSLRMALEETKRDMEDKGVSFAARSVWIPCLTQSLRMCS